MFEDELTQLLRDLVRTTSAVEVCVVRPCPELPLDPDGDGDDAGQPLEAEGDGGYVRTLPLGGGAYLRARYASRDADPNGRAAALERAARALRTCARRWEVSAIPETALRPAAPTEERARARIERYLEALHNVQHTANALVTHRGAVIAAAKPPTEMQRARLPFTLKRVEAEAGRRRGESSHAEVIGDDFYAVSFWYDACLLVFFTGEYSLDFARHRARLVTRELAGLLPMLDDDPPDPASIAPLPD
jgi:hypothetical protein